MDKLRDLMEAAIRERWDETPLVDPAAQIRPVNNRIRRVRPADRTPEAQADRPREPQADWTPEARADWTPEPQADGPTEPQADWMPELPAALMPEAEPDWMPELPAELMAEAEPDWMPELPGESMPEPQPDWMSELPGESMSEPQPDWMSELPGESMPEPKPDWMPEPQPEWMSEPPAELTPELQPDWMSEPPGESMPEPQPDWMSEPPADGPAEPQADPMAEPDADGGPESQADKHESAIRFVPVPAETLTRNRLVAALPDRREREAYCRLQENVVKRLGDFNRRVVGVTSPSDGSGKTLTAVGLAISLAADAGRPVMIIDLDLGAPGVHKLFDASVNTGIEDCLSDGVAISDALFCPVIEGLKVLPARGDFKAGADLTRSSKLKVFLDAIKRDYADDILVIDLPSTLTASDAQAFEALVDGIVLVVEDDVTEERQYRRALQSFSKRKLIGTVLNRVPSYRGNDHV